MPPPPIPQHCGQEMAIVYKAYQPALDRHVAIKLMLPQGMPDPTPVERFQQEAKLIARLRHPNVVTMLDFGEEGGVPYLVMEYVSGETLRERLKRPLALGSALEIAGQVARALDCAHREGMVHRDVNPSNILLVREDWALLSDVGIAKALESRAQLTQTGVGVGTPEYMAPEQGQGRKVDGRCDVYALGIVLYEMLTGRPPFSGEPPLSTVLMHCNEPLPPPRALNPGIPGTVEQPTFRATAKSPAERYESAGAMVEALASCLARQTAAPRPSPEAETVIEAEDAGKPSPTGPGRPAPEGATRRRTIPWPAIVVAIVVVAAVALAVLVYLGR